MASSGKTKAIGLNVWAATDPVLREDFNADNQRLDTALAPILAASGLYYASGSYTGDGQSVGSGGQRAYMSLTFDFEPLLVVIDAQDNIGLRVRTVFFKPCTRAPCTSSYSSDQNYINVTWLSNEVRWSGGSTTMGSYCFNAVGTAYVYGVIGRKKP